MLAIAGYLETIAKNRLKVETLKSAVFGERHAKK
jgi:hypothetical protein